MTSGNSGLRIDRLAMNFGGVFVFEDVSIEIPPGKVTACIGPNGAGKTTIINIVCGVFPPRAGDIFVDGVKLQGVRPFDTVRHGLCRSFQDVRIFPFLTAIENILVAMPGQTGETLIGLFSPAAKDQERANRDKAMRLLEAVKLETAAERPAAPVSGAVTGPACRRRPPPGPRSRTASSGNRPGCRAHRAPRRRGMRS